MLAKSVLKLMITSFFCLNAPFTTNTLLGQIQLTKLLTPDFLDTHFDSSFLINKTIDSTFSTQIKAALLFYPELKNAKITFRYKKSLSPLSARSSVWAIFQKPKNRRYIITISSKTSDRLTPILLKNLSFNAQVGVLGHEMSHVADFHSRKSGFFIRLLFMQLSKKAMDKFENDTDRRCIEHSLGYQLLAWSEEVRRNLHIEKWRGANTDAHETRERYMSPDSILKVLETMK